MLTTDLDPPTAFGVLLNGGQLLSGTAADAAALNTLCYIGGSAPEYLAYTTATLTGANAYTLAGLVRGAYQSNSASAHGAGDPFVRVDEAIARSGAIDRGYIGKTIYIKCTSFNVFGAAEQSLADVPAYSYTVTGKMFGRGKVFRVVSRGSSDTTAPIDAGLYDGESGAALQSRERSYMLVRIRRSDGAITWWAPYDVYGTGATNGRTAANLAADLNATGTDHIVVVYTYDEPMTNRFDSGLAAAMYRCGASRGVFGSPQFMHRSGYILVGIGACGEGNGYEAYSGAVPNDTNAWCEVTFQVKAGNLIISGNSATPRTLADYSYTGDLNATNDLTLISHGASAMTISGNTVTKPATAADAWDSGVYSKQASPRAALVSWTVSQTTKPLMVGLNQDPASDANYTSIDAAIYCKGSGDIEVYESGAFKANYGPYSAGDTFAVHYDGATIRYVRNGVVFATTAWLFTGLLYLDSSFHAPGGQVTNLRFVPLSPVADIGTTQLAGAAVNETLTLTSASYGYSTIT